MAATAYRGAFERETLVTIITGFLGSGKSSFINAMIGTGMVRDTAFIVNEFGEIPIDHLLIDAPQEKIALLPSGCLCCAVSGSLEQTLQNLFMRRARGLMPGFSSVVIETSGMASPIPAAETVLFSRVAAKNFRLGGIIAIVDALDAGAGLRSETEAAEQVTTADLVLISKSDIAKASDLAKARDSVRALNEGAEIRLVSEIRAEPAILARAGLMRIDDVAAPSPGWKNRLLSRTAQVHDGSVDSVACLLDGPVEWQSFSAAVGRILQAHDGRMLRLKGIVSVAGIEGRMIVQGVRRQMEPPRPLAGEGAADADALVFIGRDLDRAFIERSLAALFPSARGVPQTERTRQ